MAKTRMKLIVEAVQMLKGGAADDTVRAHVLQHGDEDVDAEEVLQAARNRLQQNPFRAEVMEDPPPRLPIRSWTVLRVLPVIILLLSVGVIALLIALALSKSAFAFAFSGAFGAAAILWLVLTPLYLELTGDHALVRWLLWKKSIRVRDVASVQVEMQTIESQHKIKGVRAFSTFTNWFWVRIDATDGRWLRVRVTARSEVPSLIRAWARVMGFGTQLNELEDRVLVYKTDPDLDFDLDP